jgi:hypothetical protein
MGMKYQPTAHPGVSSRNFGEEELPARQAERVKPAKSQAFLPERTIQTPKTIMQESEVNHEFSKAASIGLESAGSANHLVNE